MALILPSIALVSWWNPFSWFKKVPIDDVEVVVPKEAPLDSEIKKDIKETSILENKILPDFFTIQLGADNSSSGASRKYNGELTFENNKLINGFQNYKVSPGRCEEGVTNCDRYTECIIKNQKWVDVKNKGECMIDPFVALTIDGIQKQINTKEIIYSENINSCHYSTCYKIKK